jgi:pyruvate formate lyase activating enzyme
MHEALHHTREPDGSVRCTLCGQHCHIEPGATGLCGVRRNDSGMLVTEVYGRAATSNIDPVEKKPLWHVYPGALAMSVATVGCNLRCRFCQNWDLSQSPKSDGKRLYGRAIESAEIIEQAVDQRCRIMAYTYSEPTIFYEWALDLSKLAVDAGMLNAFITNGYIEAEPLREISPWLHAANVDLKAFRDETYRDVMGATRGVRPVLDTLRLMKELGIWIEVTTLVVPGMNDSDGELRDIAGFIAGELGADTPWHVTRYHPDYQSHEPPTPVDSLIRAAGIGRDAGLRYVYVGNVPGGEGENTACPSCGELLIDRSGYFIAVNHITSEGTCPKCAAPIAGIGMGETPLLPE